jgi:hypothetical protein
VARAERFVWLTARVLEQRRFALHFLNGDDGRGAADRFGGSDAIEAALTAYRNEDGGYGHALEPDLRGPSSEPLHVAYALRVLEEIGRCGGRQAERVCRYLTTVSTPEGALSATRAPRHAYPTAPWIPVAQAPRGDLPATGPVVGTLHRNDVWHPWLFRATDFCWNAVETLREPRPYEVRAAVAFLDAAPDRRRAEAAAERLGRLVREQQLVELDPIPEGSGARADGSQSSAPRERRAPASAAGVLPPSRGPRTAADDGRAFGAPGERPVAERNFPYDFAPTPRSLARRWFTDAEIERSLDVLASAQEADGGWPARRHAWTPASSMEQRPIVTIEALLTLRAYGRRVN